MSTVIIQRPDITSERTRLPIPRAAGNRAHRHPSELQESDVPFSSGLAVMEQIYTDEEYYGTQMFLAGLSWALHLAPDGRPGFLCGLYAYTRRTRGSWPQLILNGPIFSSR